MDSALVGAGAALGGVVLGQLFARSGEYRKWLRVERHRTASELLAAGEGVRTRMAQKVAANFHGTPASPDGTSHAHSSIAAHERLDLALEAVRTVFPPRTVALAEEFTEAAKRVGRVKPGDARVTPSPGFVYLELRTALALEVRRLVAPMLWDRLGARRAHVTVALPAPKSVPDAGPAPGEPA